MNVSMLIQSSTGLDIDVVEARWILGLLPPESLPDVAVAAIQNGIENEPLILLAGLSKSEADEAAAYFGEALHLLGRGKLTEKEAVLIYADHISEGILNKKVAPYEGAKSIWKAAQRISDTNFHDVDPFIYAASEYEDRPEDRDFFDRAIYEEALRYHHSFGNQGASPP